MKIAYLTSVYARASDSFVRGEVRCLRALGAEVGTFSVRREPADSGVSEEIREEQARTVYLLEEGALKLGLACVGEALRSPGNWFKTLRIATKLMRPGLRQRLLPLVYFAESCLLARLLRAGGFAHLHNHIGENSAAVAMLASALSGVPYSLTIHGPGEFDRPMELSLGLKVERSKFTVAISQYTRSQLFRWVDAHAHGRIQIVRCGINPQFFEPRPATEISPDVFVCIGRLSEQKGHVVLLRAMAELSKSGSRAVVRFIGDGPLRAELITLARELGVSEQVEFLGSKSAAEVREQLASARAMVLPSFAEGLPVVIMESLALGRPVVSTYVAGIPELVRNGESGWLVPAGDVSALTAAMRACLAAPVDRLLEMGLAGRKEVCQRHHSMKEAARLLELIQAPNLPR